MEASKPKLVVEYREDETPPTVTIENPPANSTLPFDVRVRFSEAVKGFDAATDVRVGNGSAAIPVQQGTGASVYTVTITPDGLGDITIQVPADVAQDLAGNNNTALMSAVNVAYNATPTVTITGAPEAVNRSDILNVTVRFSEEVMGFDATDVTVGNGRVVGFIQGTDASVYTVTITPMGSGDITIQVPENVAQDLTGIDNEASDQITVPYDNVKPTVTINGAPEAVNSTETFDVRVRFSEAVMGFTAADVWVVNGRAAAPVQQGNNASVYTVPITPNGDLNISIDVPANVVQDIAGNGNRPSDRVIVLYDAIAPTVRSIMVPETSVNSTEAFTATITFSEEVKGFGVDDVTVRNGVAGAPVLESGSTNVYTVEITPNGSGNININVPANVVQDVAGNNNEASAGVTVRYDARPTVTITGAPGAVNSTDPFNVTVSFSEEVMGFDAADVRVQNGVAATPDLVPQSDNAAAYTVRITPNGVGAINIKVPANVAQDMAGNGNRPSDRVTVADNVAPTVTITAPETVNSTFEVTVRFSEEVTRASQRIVTVRNGRESLVIPVFLRERQLQHGSIYITNYRVRITPTDEGEITLQVPSGAARDVAGNDNGVSDRVTVVYDVTSPTVTISGAPEAVNRTDPFNVTVRFSEEVTGFAATDVRVENGMGEVLGLRRRDNRTAYAVRITPSGSGEININVPANVVQDVAGNDNGVSNRVTVAYDVTAPTVTISGAPEAVNRTDPFNVTVNFSEVVTGFDATDVRVENGRWEVRRDSRTAYTVRITPDGVGEININVPANVVQDVAGNDNGVSNRVTVAYDVTAPTVEIIGAPEAVNSTESFNVTVNFSEVVTGFDAADVRVQNGVAATPDLVPQSDNAAAYTVRITPNGSGAININVPAGVAQDLGDNDNEASSRVTVDYDLAVLLVNITAPLVVNNNPFEVTVRFSEAVRGFNAAADVTVTNGVAGVPVSENGNNAVYTVPITPDGRGEITLQVPAGVAQHRANNGSNTRSTLVTVAYDVTAPTVAITGAPEAVNRTEPFDVTVTFSEAVTGFDAEDVTVENGNAGAPVLRLGSTTAYTVAITPSGSGEININVPANVVRDLVDNNNGVSNQVTVAYDVTSPTVIITGAPEAVNRTEPFDVTVTFSEAVTGFDAADVTVENGNAGAPVLRLGSTTAYTVAITPDGSGDIIIQVRRGGAQDRANNGNSSSNWVTVTDNVAPTVVIRGAPEAVNRTEPFNVTVSFSEKVSGFNVDDVTVRNGVAGAPVLRAGSTTAYTVAITPNGRGDIIIQVRRGGAQDRANNGNSSSNRVTVTDNVAPTVVIRGAPEAVNSTEPFNVTVSFSEEVNGFGVDDVTVRNGVAGAPVLRAGSTTAYTVAITPNGSGGNITLQVPANVVRDAAGNNNEVSEEVTVTYDAIAPEVDITVPVTSFSSTEPFIAMITFSEAVTGFTVDDVEVTGAVKGLFRRMSGSVYTLALIGEDDITINVQADVAQDLAGNNNTALMSEVRVAYDAPPTVYIFTPSVVNSTNPFDVKVRFFEEVMGFDAATDVTVRNGMAGVPVQENGNAAVYTVTITPNGRGDINIQVPADVAQDLNGNGNLKLSVSGKTVRYDNTAPTVIISSSRTTVNYPMFDVTVSFSETITGFDADAVTVENGTVLIVNNITPRITTNRSGRTGTKFTVRIRLNSEGAITIQVPADVVQDVAGNDNRASNEFILVYDVTAPTVVINNAPPAVNSGAFDVMVRFSEAVKGFDVADVTVENGNAGAPVQENGNAAVYRVPITPNGGGDIITIQVPADAAQDVAENGNETSDQVSVTYDVDAPTVTIANQPNVVNNLRAFDVTVTFSEAVTGFAAEDVRVDNGMAGAPVQQNGNNNAYTVPITPNGGGAITIRVPADAVRDVAENDNEASDQVSVTYDADALTVTISDAPTWANSTAVFNVTVTFSETVTGFAAADVTVENGRAGTPVQESGNAAVYTVPITPGGTDDITIQVPADVAQDVGTNNKSNVLSNKVIVPYDATAPDVVRISGLPPAVNNLGAFNVTVTFSEAVMGFDAAADVTVGNGSAAAPVQQSIDASVYTVAITPNGEGDITIQVPTGAVQDLAENENRASDLATVVYDNVAPTVKITVPAASVNSTNQFIATITFSEAVTGFDAADVRVENGGAAPPVLHDDNAAVYTVPITPNGSGNIIIRIPKGVAEDEASNGNTASIPVTVSYDIAAPTVTIRDEPRAANRDAFDVTVKFSEAVTGFDAADVMVRNGRAGNPVLYAGSTTAYTVPITPNGGGNITIQVLPNVVQDVAGNNNKAASNEVSVPFDVTAPTVTISSPARVANRDVFNVTVRFSEAVMGFDAAADVTVGNGSAAAPVLQRGHNNVYRVPITPDGNGDITIQMLAGAAQDLAGNNNEVSDALGVPYDGDAPTVTITNVPPAVNNLNPFDVTVTFSEVVIDSEGFTDFDAAEDVTVTNGRAGVPVPQSGSTNAFTVRITPNGNGNITIQVPEGAAEDLAYNDNETSDEISVPYDVDAPTVAITAPGAVNNLNAFDVTVRFSEAVTGFDAASNVRVTNGSVAVPVQGSDASVYTVAITPDGGGNITIQVPPNVVQDIAGNDNEVSDQVTVPYDADAAPTVNISGISLAPTSLALTVGGATGTLNVAIEPDDATNQNVTWESNDKDIATVDNGVVTPVSEGNAIITVTTMDGGFTATATVSVAANVPVTSITITPASLNLTAGGATGTLNVAIEPDNATNPNVSWESDATGVATVNENGAVTPVSEGIATITATAADGSGEFATATVTVVDPLGIPEEENVAIYPNPVKQVLRIDIPQEISTSGYEVQILDMNSRLLRSNKYKGGSSLEVDVRDLANGVHFIVLKSKEKELKHRFIKQ